MNEQQHRQAVSNLEKLPDFCFSVLNTTNEVILIKRGEEGYRQYHNGRVFGFEEADKLNKQIGVTPAQAEAMYFGSMYGWHVKGADVEEAQKIVDKRNERGI